MSQQPISFACVRSNVHTAAANGLDDDLTQMVATGVDVNAVGCVPTGAPHGALSWIRIVARVGMAHHLLHSPCSPHTLTPTQGDYDSRTAMHLAASMGKLQCVRALLASKAILDPEDRWGSTPLQVRPQRKGRLPVSPEPVASP